MSEGTEARRYLRRHHSGMLATLSKRLGGYPFGSVVPFVLDHDAQPAILVSRLAEHTKNMAADPRASLLVHDVAEDVQTGRATDRRRRRRALSRTRQRSPPATCAISPTRKASSSWAISRSGASRAVFVRHIAGFGAIRSITPQRFAPPENRLADTEDEIVAHMNADHGDALRGYCRHATGAEPSSAALIGIDCDGLDVRADGALVRIEFDAPVTNAGEARAALAALARRVRGE